MQPDYRLLARAERVARDLFPNAVHIKPLWTPNNPHSLTCVQVMEARGAGRVLSIDVDNPNAVSVRAAGYAVTADEARELLPHASGHAA